MIMFKVYDFFHYLVFLSYDTMKGANYMNGQYYSYNMNRQPMRPGGPRPGDLVDHRDLIKVGF